MNFINERIWRFEKYLNITIEHNMTAVHIKNRDLFLEINKFIVQWYKSIVITHRAHRLSNFTNENIQKTNWKISFETLFLCCVQTISHIYQIIFLSFSIFFLFSIQLWFAFTTYFLSKYIHTFVQNLSIKISRITWMRIHQKIKRNNLPATENRRKRKRKKI